MARMWPLRNIDLRCDDADLRLPYLETLYVDGTGAALDTMMGRMAAKCNGMNEPMVDPLPARLHPGRSRIMYIEDKSSGLEGPARIGRVFFSKTGKTLYYQDRRFQSLKGTGWKANYYDIDTGDAFWISGPRRDRHDRLYGGCDGVVIDEDVHEDYLALLRGARRRSASAASR